MDERQIINDYVIIFIQVLDTCYRETSHASDKALYATDMVYAIHWILQLHSGVSVNDVAQAICSSATSKCFTDFWKSGVWGSIESKALADLQARVGFALAT